MIEQLDWEEIKKTALLGTDRRPLSANLIQQAAALGIDPEAAPEKILGSLILAGNLLLKTARVLPKDELENITEKDSESLAPCPPYIAGLLPKILKNEWDEILKEFTQVIQSKGWKFPTQYIPALLDKAIEEPSFWKKIMPLISPQGYWLIQHNPKWRDLNGTPSKSDLDFSPQVFEKKRSIDIEVANAHLLQHWPKLKKVKKIQYLSFLESGAAHQDESFIIALWDEKNAAVKTKLFDLLLNISGSKISKTRSNFLSSLINKKKNILLPELSDEDKVELKLIANHPEFKGGLKANFLTQILAGTNWSTWVDVLKISTGNFSAWIKKQDWEAQIFQSLFHIVARENNEALRALIFKYYYSNDQAIPDDLSLFFKGISVEQFSQLSRWSFEQGETILNEENIFIKMALSFDQAWPNEATFGFFKMVKLWLRKNPRYWEGWYIWQIIRRLSFRADPKSLPLMQQAFQQDVIWSLAEEEINKFLSVLKFRQQLYID